MSILDSKTTLFIVNNFFINSKDISQYSVFMQYFAQFSKQDLVSYILKMLSVPGELDWPVLFFEN